MENSKHRHALSNPLMTKEPITLGLMPPLTGVVGLYGAEIVRAAQIACQEVNASGGVLGRPLELAIEDDGSLPDSAVLAAKKLIRHRDCTALIGNLLSNSRIAVAYRVAEPLKIPYLNFSFYEGSILSRYFFHFAALPNQQIDRMVPYMREKHGPRMFFAGNNYEWPRGSIDAAKGALLRAGGEVVGEEYCPIGASSDELERLLDKVESGSPDVFVPYFAGADQVNLLTRFTERGLKKRMAVVMGHYDEMMASKLPREVREGFYSSNTYFMTIDTAENRGVLSRLATSPGVTGLWPGGNGVLTNFGEGTYVCVKAFAKAANDAGGLDPEALVDALERVCVAGPQGEVRMDAATHHASVNTYLARCDADGSFPIVERFGAIAPVLPARYRHQRIGREAPLGEDIHLQARMLEQMSEAVFLVDAIDASIIFRNPSANRVFGYDGTELIGAHLSVLDAARAVAPVETWASVVRLLAQKGSWQGELSTVRKDGTSIWCTVSISAFTHPTHGEVWMCVAADITARKHAETEWLTATRRLNEAQSIAHIGSWTREFVSGELIWSDEMFRLLELDPLHVGATDEALRDAVHPDDRDAVNQAYARSLETRRPYEITHRLLMSDGRIKWLVAKCTSEFDTAGNPLRSTGTVQDVSEQRQAEAARTLLEAKVRERDELLQTAINLAPMAVFAHDLEGRYTLTEGSALKLIGLSPGQLIGQSAFELYASTPGLADRLRRAIGGERISMQSRIGARSFDITYGPLRDARGQPAGAISVALDVTPRVHAQQLIEESEARLRLALEAGGQATAELNLETMVTTFSPELAQMLGYSAGDLPSQDAAFRELVHPDDLSRVLPAFEAHLAGRTPKYQAELRLRTRSGKWKWLLAHGKLVAPGADGRPGRMLGTYTDIDDRKEAEFRLAASLHEKETLLREVHHRVKNNLQVISSLLHFQQKKSRTAQDLSALAELRQRVFAMTLVHERLYQSSDLARVDFGDYLQALVAELGNSLGLRPGVRLAVTSDEVRLPIELALPSGMIVCELVINVLKYAFPEGSSGTATVSVRAVDGRVDLRVDDDGVGFPAEFDPRGGAFGWDLVRSLVRQLDGTVETTTEKGAHVHVSFPVPKD